MKNETRRKWSHDQSTRRGVRLSEFAYKPGRFTSAPMVGDTLITAQSITEQIYSFNVCNHVGSQE